MWSNHHHISGWPDLVTVLTSNLGGRWFEPRWVLELVDSVLSYGIIQILKASIKVVVGLWVHRACMKQSEIWKEQIIIVMNFQYFFDEAVIYQTRYITQSYLSILSVMQFREFWWRQKLGKLEKNHSWSFLQKNKQATIWITMMIHIF